MGLSDSPLCRKCGAEEETSAHVLCECEALATDRRTYLGSFFLDPEDVRELSLGAIWNFIKRTGLLWLGLQLRAQRACQRPMCIGTARARPFIYSFYSMRPCVWSVSSWLLFLHERLGIPLRRHACMGPYATYPGGFLSEQSKAIENISLCQIFCLSDECCT